MKKIKTGISPWKTFNDWLFDPDFDRELEDDVIKAINPRSIMCMFSGMYEFTIFMNETFNDLSTIFKLKPREFYDFVKKMVHRKSIDKYDTTFLKGEKKDKEIRELHKHLPHLKTYEVKLLLEMCKDDEEYESFAISLGLQKKDKLKKLTKKQKKELCQTGSKKIEKLTMREWSKNFSN